MHEAISFGLKDAKGNISKDNLWLIEYNRKKFGRKLKKVSCKVLHAFLTDMGIPRRNLAGQKLGLRKRQILARKRGLFKFAQNNRYGK